MRRAARRDANEPELVASARRIGLKVFYTSELGDLLVQYGDVTELWEVKTETGKLTDAQCRRKRQGLKSQIIRSKDDVLAGRSRMINRQLAITNWERKKHATI